MVIAGGRETDAELSESRSDVLGQSLSDGIVLNDGGMDTEPTLKVESVDTAPSDRVSEGISVNVGAPHGIGDKLGDSSADRMGDNLHSEYVSQSASSSTTFNRLYRRSRNMLTRSVSKDGSHRIALLVIS